MQCRFCRRFFALRSSGPVQKYIASSCHTANRGVTCGRPSGRTVESQNTSASLMCRRPSAQSVAVAPGLLNPAWSSAAGISTAMSIPFVENVGLSLIDPVTTRSHRWTHSPACREPVTGDRAPPLPGQSSRGPGLELTSDLDEKEGRGPACCAVAFAKPKRQSVPRRPARLVSRARRRRPTRAHPGPCPGFRSISSRCESRDARECRLSRWLLHNSLAVGEHHPKDGRWAFRMGRRAQIERFRAPVSHGTRLEGVYATATVRSDTAVVWVAGRWPATYWGSSRSTGGRLPTSGARA